MVKGVLGEAPLGVPHPHTPTEPREVVGSGRTVLGGGGMTSRAPANIKMAVMGPRGVRQGCVGLQGDHMCAWFIRQGPNEASREKGHLDGVYVGGNGVLALGIKLKSVSGIRDGIPRSDAGCWFELEKGGGRVATWAGGAATASRGNIAVLAASRVRR